MENVGRQFVLLLTGSFLFKLPVAIMEERLHKFTYYLTEEISNARQSIQ